MTEASSDTIVIKDPRLISRFEEVREDFDDSSVPTPTDTHVLEGLIDTHYAVQNDYYTDDYTPNDKLRELVKQWQEEYEKQTNLNNDWRASVWFRCMKQLEDNIQTGNRQ